MRRQEEKYFLNQEELSLLLADFGAFPTYPIRQINSIYFDTADYKNFSDSEEGVVPRRKNRFRWYGDQYEIPKSGTLEIKITNDHFRKKEIAQFSYNSRFELVSCFQGGSYGNLIPVCQVSYHRAYYENLAGLRFTFDFDVRARLFTAGEFRKIQKTILEIKYSSDKGLSDFASLLGDRKTRFSKYNEAVEKLIQV